MPEIGVENQVCPHCGVEVREGADFCYNCGKPVSPGAVNHAAQHGRDAAGDEPHRSNGAAAKALTIEVSSKDSAPEPKRKLQSAAALRRRSRSFQSAPAEVEWVKPEHGSPLFIVTSVVLTVLALLLLFAALYLR